jgi:small-conductance mechanosensitive channel
MALVAGALATWRRKLTQGVRRRPPERRQQLRPDAASSARRASRDKERNMPEYADLIERLLVTAPPVVAVLGGALLLNLLLGRGLQFIAHKAAFGHSELSPIHKLGRWLINGAALVLLLGVLGFNLGGIWAMMATVVGMVAIGFVAVWSVLSNTLCTIIILICRPFDIGDEIELAGEPVQGKVIDLNFIYTTLSAGDGVLIQIPNNLFLQRVVKRRRGRGGVSLAHQLSSDYPASL